MEENKAESTATERAAGPARLVETARVLIRKTKRATRRRFPVEDKVRIVMEGIRGELPVAELCLFVIRTFETHEAVRASYGSWFNPLVSC